MERKILIIDDGVTHLLGVKRALEDEGYEVISTASSREGIALARSASPDCILLDLLMPEIDGVEVCREIKSNGDRGFVPLIMLTSKDTGREMVRGLDAGADDYVNKSDDIEVLMARIHAALRVRDLYAELKEANEQFRERDNLKTEFISTASHELRTPLTAIKEGLSLIVDGIAGEVGEKAMKYINIAMKNSERLAALINDLLDISKLEAGKMRMERDAGDVGEVVNESVSSLQDLVLKNGLKITTDLHGGLPPVYADRNRVGQVLINLIGNAIKFSKEGGSIKLSARPTTGMIEVSVTDTGVGIAPEHLDGVFNKFQQFNRIRSSGVKGTGLGLAISKEIINLHKGRIWVESQLGRGSTFYFTVPVYSDELNLQESFEEAILRANEDGTPLALVLVNISNFPLVQKEHGEDIAEQLITTIQEIIRSKLRRKDDVVIRGNQEGLIAVLAQSDQDGARAIVANMKGSLGCYEFDFPLTLQVGQAVYSSEGKNRQELFRTAESRLQRFPTRLKGTNRNEERKILIVDDEEDIVELFSERLEEVGYTTLKAYGGQEAIETIKEQYVDLVVLDLAMPEVSGYGVIGYLKTNEVTSDIPILILSAHHADERELERLGAPAIPKLLKGCANNIFLETVENILERHRS